MNKKKAFENVKAIIFDADGVIFTGSVFMGNESEGNGKKGEVMKLRSHIDGQGISFLRAIGIRIAFITAETSGFVESLGEKLNSLPSVKNGSWPKIDIFSGAIGKDKAETARVWLEKIGIKWSECAYMGDDIGDYSVMKKVGFPTAPSQAEEEIKAISLFVAKRKGGEGAIRDLCNYILEAKGIDKLTLELR